MTLIPPNSQHLYSLKWKNNYIEFAAYMSSTYRDINTYDSIFMCFHVYSSEIKIGIYDRTICTLSWGVLISQEDFYCKITEDKGRLTFNFQENEVFCSNIEFEKYKKSTFLAFRTFLEQAQNSGFLANYKLSYRINNKGDIIIKKIGHKEKIYDDNYSSKASIEKYISTLNLF